MLVLSRKVGQRILIGDQISVTVVRIGQGGVRLGIEAPDDFEVVREELKHPKLSEDAASPAENSRIGAAK